MLSSCGMFYGVLVFVFVFGSPLHVIPDGGLRTPASGFALVARIPVLHASHSGGRWLHLATVLRVQRGRHARALAMTAQASNRDQAVYRPCPCSRMSRSMGGSCACRFTYLRPASVHVAAALPVLQSWIACVVGSVGIRVSHSTLGIAPIVA